MRFTFDDNSVRRNSFAGFDDKNIVFLQSIDRNKSFRILDKQSNFFRHQPVKHRNCPRRPLLRAFFHQFAQQHERYNGGGSIEINKRFAAKSLNRTIKISRQNSGCEKRFHPNCFIQKSGPGKLKNRFCRIKNDRRGKNHQDKRENKFNARADFLKITDVKRHAQGHNVRPEKTGDADPQNKIAFFRRRSFVVGIEFARLVAKLFDSFGDSFGRQKLRAIFDLDQIGSEKGFGAHHAALVFQAVFDEPRTSRTPHSRNVQKLFFGRRVSRYCKILIFFLAVRDQAEFETSFENFAVSKILPARDHAAFRQNRKNIQTTETAKRFFFSAEPLQKWMASDAQTAKVAMFFKL